jgi:thiamine biosynthesis lipoprotein
MTLNRRRFLTISAGFGLAGIGIGIGIGADAGMARARASGAGLYIWRGVAMGAGATIALDHPDAPALCAAAAAEIDRLENIFSLYRADSALSTLNREGEATAPAPELLDCLSLAGLVHRHSGGRFDPTVQPLWALYAQSYSAGRAPTGDALRQTLGRVGWDRVSFAAGRITLAPGTALTLNGIAQGYVADRVAELLRARGLRDVLIDTGEIRALGHAPDGDWPVTLASGRRADLRDRALASSAPNGTCFDAAGRVGHILDPRDGRPASARWGLVSVSAPGAALADALSTAGCLMPDRASLSQMVAAFDGARIEALLGA